MRKYILSEKDRWFLNERRNDPYLSENFEVGDEVIICSACSTIHRVDTWKFYGKCGQCGCSYPIPFKITNLRQIRESNISKVYGFTDGSNNSGKYMRFRAVLLLVCIVGLSSGVVLFNNYLGKKKD